MDRRAFVRLLAAAPLVPTLQVPEPTPETLPKLRVVTKYPPAAVPGMPGPYPGRVIAVKSEKCVDTVTSAANDEVVREMMARGMCALTGEKTAGAAWKRFIVPADVVGIKVNCGGHPWCVSAYEIVAEIVRQLGAAGVPPTRVYIYERFQNQLDNVNYAPHLPEGVTIAAAETANRNSDNRGYDPATYVEANLFGEDDTRSNMMRLVTQKLTKIINVPNMKDHGATGATGCLKNIAYGSFSNVARTHHRGKSHTYSFVGALAAVEPLRSRTVLQIMDGLRGVWHAGPFARTRKYVFYPKQILFGTDPVAIDRLLLDIIDNERKAHGAISIYDRSPQYLKMDDGPARDADPNVNIIIREPGHVEHAATLGLGVADKARIKVQDIVVILSLFLAAFPCLFWSQGVETAPSLKSAGIERLCVASDQAEAWRKAGFEVSPQSEMDLALREILPAPGTRPRAGRASPTRTPWIDASGWRFLRDPAGLFSYELPAGKAAMAAAEAYAYGANALLKVDPADLPSLGAMMAFLAQLPASELPAVSDFAVVDDGSAVLGEVLNLLVRRNLLFQIAKEPSPQLPITVKVGTKEYPQSLAGDPSAFALAVRRQLGDDRRTLRIFGSEVVIGRLTGDGSRHRLHLLNYGNRDLEGLRIRVRGTHPEGVVSVPGQGRMALEDRSVIDGGTEFTVPRLGPYGVVDLPAVK